MAISYYNELENINQYFDNKKKKSINDIYPAFLSPGGQIIRIANKHMNAIFLDCISYIEQLIINNPYNEINALNDEIKILNIKINKIMNEKFVTNEDIYQIYQIIYSEPICTKKEVIDSIVNILNSKVYIYHYYINLLTYNLDSNKIINDYNKIIGNDSCDLLIQFMDFDKFTNKGNKCIVTSKLNINEQFFNYLILEYDIDQRPKFVFDKNKKIFTKINDNNIIEYNDNNVKEEIELIKKYIPMEERKKYFK